MLGSETPLFSRFSSSVNDADENPKSWNHRSRLVRASRIICTLYCITMELFWLELEEHNPTSCLCVIFADLITYYVILWEFPLKSLLVLLSHFRASLLKPSRSLRGRSPSASVRWALTIRPWEQVSITSRSYCTRR